MFHVTKTFLMSTLPDEKGPNWLVFLKQDPYLELALSQKTCFYENARNLRKMHWECT